MSVYRVVFLARAQAWRKGRAYEDKDASGAAARFRGVSDPFAASFTGRLAAIEDKIHTFTTPIPI